MYYYNMKLTFDIDLKYMFTFYNDIPSHNKQKSIKLFDDKSFEKEHES